MQYGSHINRLLHFDVFQMENSRGSVFFLTSAYDDLIKGNLFFFAFPGLSTFQGLQSQRAENAMFVCNWK